MADALRFRRLAGPDDGLTGEMLAITTDGATLGRSPTATHCLPAPSVSRLHARFRVIDGAWHVADLDSTSGTRVDGLPLESRLPAKLGPGSTLDVGPYRLMVVGEGDTAPSATTTEPADATIALRTVTGGKPATAVVTSRRLDALSRCIDELVNAKGEAERAAAALRSAILGAGFRRGAVLRPPSGDTSAAPGRTDLAAMAIVALERAPRHGRHRDHAETAELFTPTKDLVISTSLVSMAAEGRTATLTGDPADARAELASIAELKIHSAVCVPVHVEQRLVALLYLDARGGEAPVRDAADYCEDVARLLGLAMAYAARAEQAKRQAAMQAELERARSLRSMLAPAESLNVGGYRVAHRTLAGLVVSGDLFDVIRRDDGSAAVLFGDATGHGVGAAMLTSLVHAHLHAEVSRTDRVEHAIERTNRFVTSKPTGGSFVSLIVAELRASGEVRYADAGHGYWRVVRSSGEIERAPRASGVPLGVDPEATYAAGEVHLGVGDRLVLFTDGLVEQRDASGAEVGDGAVDRALASSADAAGDVEALSRLLLNAAGRAGVDDDATIASVHRVG